VTFGYQGDSSEDMEPNSEDPLFGITLKKTLNFEGGVSGIFVETIRDAVIDRSYLNQINNTNIYPNIREDYWWNIQGIVAHEVGHAPGNTSETSDHNESDLMQGEVTHPIRNEHFSPATIRRFRGATQWSH